MNPFRLPILVPNIPSPPTPGPLRLICRDPPTESGHCDGIPDEDMEQSRIQIYVWKDFKCQSVLWMGCSPRTKNFFYHLEDCVKSCHAKPKYAGTGHGKYDRPGTLLSSASSVSSRMVKIQTHQDVKEAFRMKCQDRPARTVEEG